jgi:prevent-host-death family protein
MVMKRVSASAFKARCLAILDEVAETGEEVEITKRGRPVARVVAVEQPRSLAGSVEFLVEDDDLIAPVDVDWDAARE